MNKNLGILIYETAKIEYSYEKLISLIVNYLYPNNVI